MTEKMQDVGFDLGSIYISQTRLIHLFESHGISTADRTWILKQLLPHSTLSPSRGRGNLCDTVSQLCALFEILPEWLQPPCEIKKPPLCEIKTPDPSADASLDPSPDPSPRVFQRHLAATIEAWAEQLIIYKYQAWHPRIVFVQSQFVQSQQGETPEQDGTLQQDGTPQQDETSQTESSTLVFVELTKKISQSPMPLRVYRQEQPPSCQAALVLVENALLPYRGILLESRPYQALCQGLALPTEILCQGKHWDLSSLKILKDGPKYIKDGPKYINETQGNAIEEEREEEKERVVSSLHFYAEKLRYTLPMAFATQPF